VLLVYFTSIPGECCHTEKEQLRSGREQLQLDSLADPLVANSHPRISSAGKGAAFEFWEK